MATISSRIQIEMLDKNNHIQSFNIDYPKNNMTLGSIRVDLNDAIATNSWCSSYSVPFIRVNKATLIETEKTQLSNDGDGISVTPAEANLTTNEIKTSQIFTVTGIDIEGYNYTKISGSNNIYPVYEETIINSLENTIKATFQPSYSVQNGETAQYNFTITGSGFSLIVPITITINR